MEEVQVKQIKNNRLELVKKTTCNSEHKEFFKRYFLKPSQVTNLKSPNLAPSERCKMLYDTLIKQQGSFKALVQSLEATQQTEVLTLLLNSRVFGNYGKISYDKTKLLHSGGFNGDKIYQGKFGGRAVAVKIVNIGIRETKLTLREVDMLEKLDGHENIVRYFTVEMSEDSSLQTALELFQISIQDAIKSNMVNSNPVKILSQCISGLAHIHSMKVIHTDLNPANILLKANGQVKICNFGLAQQLTAENDSTTVYSENVRDKDWMAPEMLKHFVEDESEGHLIEMSAACDVFSVGCIFFFVLTKGAHPFGSPILRQSHIYYDKPQLQNSTLETNWLQLIRRMISHASRERPSTTDVLLDSCFLEDAGTSASRSEDMPISTNQNNVMCAEEPGTSTPRLPIQLDPNLNTSQQKVFSTVSAAKRPLAIEQNALEQSPCSSRKLKRKKTDVHPNLGKVVIETSTSQVQVKEPNHVDDEGNNTLCQAVLKGKKLEELKRIVNNGTDLSWKNTAGESILHLAVKQRNSEVVKYLITAGADVNAKDNSGQSPIHKLKDVKLAFREKLSILIENGADINAVDESDNTILGLAAYSGRSKSDLEHIISKTGDWKHRNGKGETALHLAVEGGSTEAIRYLIKVGLKVDVEDDNGEMPIHRICHLKETFKETVDVLLEHGADVNAIDEMGETVLALVTRAGRSKEELKYIVTKGGQPETTNIRGHSILHLAALGSNLEAMNYLIELGVSVNLKDNRGNVPLHNIANAKREFKTFLDVLLENGADINVQDENGDTLLTLSVYYNRPCADLKYIVEKGGNWKLRMENQSSVLHIAAQSGSLEAIKYFVSLGLSVDARDYLEMLPLHHVIWNQLNFEETVNVLLSFGTSINATVKDGLTLLSWAACNGKKQIFEYLISRGADWRMKNRRGQTILHMAAMGGNADTIKFIIELGGRVDARDKNGNFPLHLITNIAQNFRQCLDTFLEHGARINAKNTAKETLLDFAYKKKKSDEDLNYVISKGGTGTAYKKIRGQN